MNEKSIGDEQTIGDHGSGSGSGFPPGEMLGQYRVIRLLGRGGMGEVYEVEHRVLGKRYALKLLPPDFAARAGALARFEREARVMANLEHPHIVRVDEFGETGGRYWLRMELMAGAGEGVISLADLAKRGGGKVEQKQLLAILQQVTDGLGYAHNRGAVHRDLKPGNILLEKNYDGEVRAKVADFGLVRLVGEEWVRSQAQISIQRSLSLGDEATEAAGEGTSTRALLGTYEYMSPEQKRGEEADARSDIYALGMTAYRLLTGQELGMSTPSQIDPELAPAWDELARSALEPNRERRLEDCLSFSGLLSKVEEEISRGEKEAEERRRREAEAAARREREERERREAAVRREREDAERRAAEARRVREEEESRRRKEVAARRAVSPPPAPPAPVKRQPRRRAGKIVGVVLALCALAAGVWVWSVFQSPARAPRRPVAIAVGPRERSGQKTELDLGVGKTLELVWLEVPQGRSGEEIVLDLGGGVKLELVWIEPGSFMRGSPSGEANRDNIEGPQRRVEISRGFWMGKYEVTQDQYQRVMDKNPSHFNGGKLPVERVSWNDAKAFCDKLNRNRPPGTLQGYAFRLPTEAEWEYACRAGTTTPFHFGATVSTDQANYDGNHTYGSGRKGTYRQKTTPVGSFPPNAWGLHDMHGNVWEWCEDWYDGGYYSKSPGKDPAGPASGSSRVVRGGSWRNTPGLLRSASRRFSHPGHTDRNQGFRVVLAGR